MVRSNGYVCDGGNRTLTWSQFCDGHIDCNDRFDEEGRFCKLCINNLYSCPPQDDIRCDLACKMLHYVPCQTIQDRRACNNIERNLNSVFDFQLPNELKYYVATIIICFLTLIGIAMLIRYLIRRHQQQLNNISFKSSNFARDLNCPVETDTLSSHIYEQCYEPPSYETANKCTPLNTYYEHIV